MASLFAWETIYTSYRPKKSQVLTRATNYYHRWLPKLLGYDYEIEYKKGPENQGVDSLSFNAAWRLVDSTKRSPTKFLLQGDQNTITPPTNPAWWSMVQKWQSLLMPHLNFDSKCDCRLVTQHPLVGISGSTKLSLVLRTSFGLMCVGQWRNFCNSAIYVNGTKPIVWSLSGYFNHYQSLLECGLMFQWILSRDYHHLMDILSSIVNRLTKHSHFVALKHPYTTITIAKAFVANVVRLHIIPTSIVSHRDKVFISIF